MSSFKQFTFQPCEPKKPKPTNKTFKVNSGTGIKNIHDKNKHALARGRWGNKWFEKNKKERLEAQAAFRAKNDEDAVFGDNEGETKGEEPSVRVLRGMIVAIASDYSELVEFPDGGETRVFLTSALANTLSVPDTLIQKLKAEKKTAKEKGQAAVNDVIRKQNALIRACKTARENLCKKVKKDHGPTSDHPQLSSQFGTGDYGSMNFIHIFNTVTTDSGGGDAGDGLAETRTEDLLTAYRVVRANYSEIYTDWDVIAVSVDVWNNHMSSEEAFLNYIGKDGVKTLIIHE